MIKNKHFNADPHFEYNINSGYIYTGLCNIWPEVPREIFETIESKLKTILWQKKKVTVSYSDEMKTYLDGKRKLLDSVKQYAKDNNNPPFTEYFMQPNGSSIGFDLIAYNENCILENGKDGDFDFFFAMKLIVMDLMQFDELLDYQFEENFNSDHKRYKSFLQALLIKYRTYFKQQPIVEMVNSYIENTLKTNENLTFPENTTALKINGPEVEVKQIEIAAPQQKVENKKYPSIFTETVNPDHLTVKQASAFLNIAEQTIYGYTHRKEIPFYKPHKKLYFLKSELEEWLKQGKQGEKAKPTIQIKRKSVF